MAEYFLRNDPELGRAVQERAWEQFLNALSETTPDVMGKLQAKPFEVFRALASDFNKISSHTFGAITCEWDGKPAMTLHPLGDLAKLIHTPDLEKPKNVWPPSAPFWESTLRAPILELSVVMGDWARNFLDLRGVPHVRLLNAALGTMLDWLAEPELMLEPHWLGHARVIPYHTVQPPTLQLNFRGWDPIHETEAEFKKRVQALIKEIKEWSKNLIPEAKRRFVKYDTKRNAEHYHWAALRLARQMTYPSIAEFWAQRDGKRRTDLDETTVRKGVHSSLKVLELRDVHANRK